MKMRLIFICVVFLLTTKLNAQKHEIGIGFPSINFNTSQPQAEVSPMKWGLYRNSEVYTLHTHTWRNHSDVSPILYYTKKVSPRMSARLSLSYQREYIEHHHYSNHNDSMDVYINFDGRYTQFKFTMGLAYKFQRDRVNGFYVSADITHSLKFIKEEGELKVLVNPFEENPYLINTSDYRIGIRPCLGYKLFITKRMSCSYELGLEYETITGSKIGLDGTFFWSPLNRLSINYTL